jgi:hypothetical protein
MSQSTRETGLSTLFELAGVDFNVARRQYGDLVVGQIIDVARVLQDRRDVGGQEVFPVPDAQDQGLSLRVASSVSG